MNQGHFNVAIDGPSGAGKSTAAKLLAKELDILYLDTGAIYRTAALYALDNNIDVADGEAASDMLDKIKIDIVYQNGIQKVLLNGLDVGDRIRQNHISPAASTISGHPKVRLKLVDLQRKIAAAQSSVLDGRDIGTYILPNAKFKFYLTAAPEVRARRRLLELQQKGGQFDFETILAEINRRDYNDSHRELAPLKQAEDAILVDTGDKTIPQVIACLLDAIRSRK